VRTEDDLVTVFDAGGQQRRLQAVSRVADSKGVGDAKERGQTLFEILEVPLLNEGSPAANIGEYSLELLLLRRE
jgi:hypothetical protein